MKFCSAESFNDQIPRPAASKNTAVSRVITVDLFTNVHPATDMYDDIHPNDIGEKIWLKAGIRQ